MFGLFKRSKGRESPPNLAAGDERQHPPEVAAGDDRAWIFVSHASADLCNVRKVRNYLEEKGAAPLLFHLRALSNPKEFWPLIEREIQSRNFFLYCESSAAEKSEWVRREREAIQAALKSQPKRLGRIRVDTESLDLQQLDEFVASTRVFLAYSKSQRHLVLPFAEKLRQAGFSVFDYVQENDVASVDDVLTNEIRVAAQTGFVLIFLTTALKDTDTLVIEEAGLAIDFNARVVPILLTEEAVSGNRQYIRRSFFDATWPGEQGPDLLVSKLLNDE
jgi:hypothetical protein